MGVGGVGVKEGKFSEMSNIDALLLLKLWRSQVMFYRVVSTVLEVKTRCYGRSGVGPGMSQLTVVLIRENCAHFKGTVLTSRENGAHS